MESFGNAECRMHDPSTASGPPSLSGTAAELWDLRSAILSDLISADIKSVAADVACFRCCLRVLRDVEDAVPYELQARHMAPSLRELAKSDCDFD